MNAVICPRYGGPDVLQIRDVPKPVIKSGELLVRIYASSVNSGDVRTRALDVPGPAKLIMRLLMGWRAPRAAILGNVFSGTVEAVGGEAKGFQKGDKVYGATGGMRFGCHAEYVTVKTDGAVCPMPANATFEEAAALPFGGTTALFFLDKATSQAGERILVYGASGAVGTSVVQIARNLGLAVTAASSAANEQLVRSLGAQEWLDYTRADWRRLEKQFDIVFDAVGKMPPAQAKLLLREGGRYVTVGGLAVAREKRAQLEQLKNWFEQRKLQAVIDSAYPLAQAAQAHARVDSGRKRGSVVLQIGAPGAKEE